MTQAVFKKDGEYPAELKNILQRTPDNIEARTELAMALAGRGRCEESLLLVVNFNLRRDDLNRIFSLLETTVIRYMRRCCL